MRVQELSEKYNISESFFEIITNKEKNELIINDIKSDIGNVHIEILKFIRNTDYFPRLERQLAVKRDILSGINDSNKRLLLNDEIRKIEEEIKQYKIDILLTSYSLVTLRETSEISKIKEFFFQGNISKAINVISDSKLEVSRTSLFNSLKTKEKLEQVYQKLVENAFEFLIKGQLTSINLNIQSSDDRFQKSLELFNKGIISIEKSKNVQKEAEYKLKYSNFLRKHNNPNGIEVLIQRSLDINRSLAISNEKIYLPNVALILQSLAIFKMDENETENAEELFLETLKIRRKLNEQYPNRYLPELGSVLNDFASFLMKKNDFKKALKLYEEALIIRRELSKNAPKVHLSSLASNLNGIAILLRETKNYDKAKEYYLESLEIRSFLSHNQPNIYLPMVAEIQNNLGILYCDNNESEKALIIFSKALVNLKKLANDNPKVYSFKVGEISNNMAILYRTRKDVKKAEKFFLEAIKIFRNLIETHPKKYTSYLAATLLNLSRLYQKQIQNRELSLQLIDEMLTLLFPFRHVPFIQTYINEACKTLNALGIDYVAYLNEKEF